MILLVEDTQVRLNGINCLKNIEIVDYFDKLKFKNYEIICVHKSIKNFNEKILMELDKKVVIFSGGIEGYYFKNKNFLEIDVDIFYQNFCIFIESKELFSLIYGKNYKLKTLLEFYDRISFFEKNNEEYLSFKFVKETHYEKIINVFNLEEIKLDLIIEKQELIKYKKYIYHLIQKMANENFISNS